MVGCPKCGAAVQPDWEWCYDCGFDPDGMRVKTSVASGAGPPSEARQGGFGGQTQFTPPRSTPIPPSMGPPHRRRGLELALVGSVLVVAAVVLLYVVFRPEKNGPVSQPEMVAYDPNNVTTTTTFDTTATAVPPGATPAELMTTPANPGTSVDEATARTVLAAAYPVFEQARAAKDIPGQLSVTGGPARDAVTAFTKSTPPPVAGIGQVALSAPPQTGYPAYFLAQIVHPGPAGAQAIELVTFARIDAASPWRITLDVTYDGADPPLAPGTAAFDASTSSAANPTSLPATLAEEWQLWHDRRQPPARSPFTRSDALQAVGLGIGSGRMALESAGTQDKSTFVASDAVDGIFRFAAGKNEVLCSAIRWTTDLEPTQQRNKIEQPKDQSTFGPLLPAGKYNTVDAKGVRQFCMLVVPNRSTDVLGGDGGPYAYTAT